METRSKHKRNASSRIHSSPKRSTSRISHKAHVPYVKAGQKRLPGVNRTIYLATELISKTHPFDDRLTYQEKNNFGAYEAIADANNALQQRANRLGYDEWLDRKDCEGILSIESEIDTGDPYAILSVEKLELKPSGSMPRLKLQNGVSMTAFKLSMLTATD